MIKKITLATTLMAALLSGNAMAQDDINPWKHCGIGAMIFDDNGAAAAISNIIWDLGTTALSTKISGLLLLCSFKTILIRLLNKPVKVVANI